MPRLAPRLVAKEEPPTVIAVDAFGVITFTERGFRATVTPYYSESGITIYHVNSKYVLPFMPRPDLILTDPPFGIGFAAQPTRWQRRAGHKPEAWDNITQPDLVLPLPKLADKVVIWGGNYYELPPSRCWLSWYKPDAPPSMGDTEFAWTNLDQCSAQLTHSISATNHERVGFKTQKPLRVIKWSIKEAGFTGGTIFDPCIGSGTKSRAAADAGYRAIGCDIDEAACELSAERLRQGSFFSQ